MEDCPREKAFEEKLKLTVPHISHMNEIETQCSNLEGEIL